MSPTGRETWRSGRRVIWPTLWVLLAGSLAVHAVAPDVTFWFVEDLGKSGQETVFDDQRRGGYYGLPVEIGDYDGDGRIDLVLGPMGANSGSPGSDRDLGGEVHVFPGDGAIAGIVDRATLDPAERGLTVLGARPGDMTGTELYTADINGDGFEDLLLSAQNHDLIDPDGGAVLRDNCGAVFVVLGRPGLLDGGPTIDLAAPPEGVITLIGAEAGDRFGIWVEAGDLDGDGTADLIVGADQYPASGTSAHRGKVYVIYGRDSFPAAIDMSSFTTDVSVLLGREREDHFGACVHARDLDDDGAAELIVGAAMNRLSASYSGISGEAPGGSDHPAHGSGGADGPGNTRDRCGEVYVFHSTSEGDRRLPARIDLAEEVPAEIASRITTIYGARAGDYAGEELTSGDVDGDGYVDLIVGAILGSVDSNDRGAGAAHLVYWRPGLGGSEIDLREPPALERPEGLRVSHMRGLRQFDILGDTLSCADFDNDGFDDVALGIPHYDQGGDRNEDRGGVAIVFGRPEPLPLTFRPQATEDVPPGLRLSFVVGAEPGDLLSYSMEARDVDGDGYADLFPNAMRGDGAANDIDSAGEAVVVSGFHLSGVSVGLTEVEPNSAPVGEVVEVEITGTGFTVDTDTTVWVGDVEATSIRVDSSQRLHAELPASAVPAVVDIRIANRYGEATLPSAFRYVGDAPAVFLRGDANVSSILDLSDAVYLLGTLFLGDPTRCADAGDVNDSGTLEITDAILILEFLFQGGDAPPAPFPEVGEDPTPDDLDCANSL